MLGEAKFKTVTKYSNNKLWCCYDNRVCSLPLKNRISCLHFQTLLHTVTLLGVACPFLLLESALVRNFSCTLYAQPSHLQYETTSCRLKFISL